MKHIHRQEIRFSDIDALGHVNNATYLSYFEQARISFFEKINDGPWDWQKQGILLARNELNYLIPVKLNDITEIEVTVEKIGRKSFVLAYVLNKNDNGNWVKCTEGKSVLVAFDFVKIESTEIPEMWKNTLTNWIEPIL